MKQLEEIKARASAATAGPLEVVPSPGGLFAAVNDASHMNIMSTWNGTPTVLLADAEFIAVSRADVLKLVAALEAVEDIMTWLDMVEEVHPSSAPPGSLNVSAAGTAAVIRKVINKALEAV